MKKTFLHPGRQLGPELLATGKLRGFYGIFGDQDRYHVMLIAEMPGNAEYNDTQL